MPRFLPTLLVLLLALTSGCRSLAAAAARPTVTVVEATVSAPNEAERRASSRAADLLARLLGEAGVGVRRLTDDDVIRGALRDRVVLLAYNPNPPKHEVEQLRRHVANGGRLIVFYSSDPSLARLLGFALGPVQTPAYDGQWSAIAFLQSAPPLMPPRLAQVSRILRPALPDSPSARVIARFVDRAGRPQETPAWVISDKGAWMSHILQGGDMPSRRRLLAGLAGHFDPAILRAAAAAAVARGGTSPPYATLDAMLAQIRGHAVNGKGTLASLEAGRSELGTLYKQARYADVLLAEEKLAKQAAAAVARTARPVPGEFTAVWNSSGMGLYGGPDSWARTARLLADNGIRAVFPHVASAGSAHYPSRLLPQTAAGRAAGDPLAACIKAAQQNGLAVHAWKMCWILEGAPPELVERLRKEGRLQVGSAGQTLNWLCPSRADNVERELAAIEEIARHYDVQGVHLDYIRFPDNNACFCRACRAGFEKSEGKAVAAWPSDVLKGPLAERFVRWRTAQITRFVRLAGQRLRQAKPTAVLSAAVYGWYPGCVTSKGQDWGDWLKRDLVAFVCPMNYTDETTEFAGWLRTQMPLATGRARIIPGIGVTSISSRLNGLQTIAQIEAARRAGAQGFILYDLNDAMESAVLPLLGAGVTRVD